MKFSKNHPKCAPPIEEAKSAFYLMWIDLAGRWHAVPKKQRKNLKPRCAYLGFDKTGAATIWAVMCTCRAFNKCALGDAYAKAAEIGSGSCSANLI